MPYNRLDEAGLAALRAALDDPVVLARYLAKITTVLGSECLWWTGAVAGRADRERTDGGGHGRFWFAPGRVIIAHRFGFAAMYGVEALDQARPFPLPDRADVRVLLVGDSLEVQRDEHARGRIGTGQGVRNYVVDLAAGHGPLDQGPGRSGSEPAAPELGGDFVADLDSALDRRGGEAPRADEVVRSRRR